MNPVIETILSHKSIRKFKETQVSKEVLEWVIKSAQAASTSSFLQAYSIISVEDPAKRSKLMHLCGDQDYVKKAPVFLVFCADLQRIKAICDYDSGWTETFILATVDASLAGQNAMLAAESMGLGGVYIGGIRNNPEEVSDLLSLPEEVYPVFGMCLGYPDQSPESKPRLPMEMVCHQDRYEALDRGALLAYDEAIKTYYTLRTKGKVTDTWSESVEKKIKGELRPHMKGYLKKRNFLMK